MMLAGVDGPGPCPSSRHQVDFKGAQVVACSFLLTHTPRCPNGCCALTTVSTDSRKSVVLSRLALEYQGMGAPTSSALTVAGGSLILAKRAAIKARKPAERFRKQQDLYRLRIGVKNNKLQGKYFRLQVVQ